MREFKDRVQDTTQTTGTGPLTLDAAAIAGFRSFGSAHTVGATMEYFVGLGSDWEVGVGTLTDATHLARAPLTSSNGGALVNFGVGSKTIFETVSAAQIARALTAQDVAFSAAIPLMTPGSTYMVSKTVNAPLTFTPAANAVRGALVYLRCIADGTNLPDYSAFKEWGGSMGYDNRAGIENQMQFLFDGANYFVSISQAVGAGTTVPATMIAPTATVINGTSASVALTAPVNGGSPITGYTVTSSPAGMVDSNAGSTSLTHTMTGGTNGTSYTFTVIATNGVGNSAPSPASNSVTLTSAAALRLSQLVDMTESASPYVYTGATRQYSSSAGPGGVGTLSLPANTDGSASMTLGARLSGSGSGPVGDDFLTLTAQSAPVTFTSFNYGVYTAGAGYQAVTAGSLGAVNGTALVPALGDIVKIARVGTTITVQVARASTPSTFTTIHTFSGVATTQLYVQMCASYGSLSNLAYTGLM